MVVLNNKVYIPYKGGWYEYKPGSNFLYDTVRDSWKWITNTRPDLVADTNKELIEKANREIWREEIKARQAMLRADRWVRRYICNVCKEEHSKCKCGNDPMNPCGTHKESHIPATALSDSVKNRTQQTNSFIGVFKVINLIKPWVICILISIVIIGLTYYFLPIELILVVIDFNIETIRLISGKIYL